MALYDLQFSLATITGLPEDRITNTWHYDDAETENHAGIFAEFQAFYEDILTLFSGWMVQNGHVAKAYRVSDPEPRAPVYEVTFNFTSAPSGNTLPPECCIVLSYQADQLSGVPQARRRGRVYLGALDVSSIDTSGNFTSATIVDVQQAADGLLDASLTSTGWRWATHSQVTGTGAEVSNGWVDNAVDIQRRRGRSSTSRAVWPIP